MIADALRVTATAAVSDIGRRRANNEDCVLRLDHVPLLAVADVTPRPFPELGAR